MKLNSMQLAQCRNAELMACNPEDLADLRSVRIDTSRPVRERLDDFWNQVGNPYLFKVDGLIVKAVYPPVPSRRLCEALPDCGIGAQEEISGCHPEMGVLS